MQPKKTGATRSAVRAPETIPVTVTIPFEVYDPKKRRYVRVKGATIKHEFPDRETAQLFIDYVKLETETFSKAHGCKTIVEDTTAVQ